MEPSNTGEVLDKLSTLERGMEDLLRLVRQIDQKLAATQSANLPSEAEFFDAEGGE